jgi:hypothetical protein
MRIFRNNGLTLVLMALFLLTWAGQFFAGHHAHNEEQRQHGDAEVGLWQYVGSGHFWQATAENWESEFLQMAAFVLLTVFLYQKGSPESKDPDGDDAVDNDPELKKYDDDVPGPVRAGGFALWLYSHSLSVCFLLLFIATFALHAAKGAEEYNQEQGQHDQPAVSALQFAGTSRFWFESMQNWQSEFLSLAAMVYLSVYLRERGSAESKPVATPHDESGEEEPVWKPGEPSVGI